MPADGYHISCTTCQARLRVRDSAVIGQILSCPKCGSMVLITPPAESPTPDQADMPIAESVAMQPVEEPVGDPAVEQPSIRAATASEALPPGPDWASSESRWWQPWAMYGGAAIVGVVMAVGVWGFLLSRRDDHRNTHVANGQQQSDSSVEPRKNDGTNINAIKPPPAHDPSPHVSTESDVAARPPVPETSPAEDPQPDAEAESSIPDLSDSRAQQVEPAQPKRSIGGLEQIADLPKSTDYQSGALENPPAEKDPSTADPPGSEAIESKSPLSKSPLLEVDIQARLADKIPEIEFQGIALADFLDFLTQLSTIPITLDPSAVAHAGVTPRVSISIHQQDTTIDQVLSSVLASQGLRYIASEHYLTVEKLVPQQESLRREQYDVAGIMTGDQQRLVDLADLLRKFVAPDSWKDTGGAGEVYPDSGKLVVIGAEPVHYQVLVLLGKLRVARGAQPQDGLRTEQYQLSTRSARAKEKLRAPITVSFFEPTPLIQILDRLKQLTGVTYLVNWQALTEAGFSPFVPAALTIHDRPLQEALASLLEPMQLACRAIDERTLQITSARELRLTQELEFYRVGDLLEGEASAKRQLQRLQQSLGESHFTKQRGGRLRWDQQSKCLMARLPQPQQQALEALLATWRTQGGKEE